MTNRYKLSEKALEELDRKLFRYRTIEEEIHQRKYVLEHSKKPPDKNIGGGKANNISKPVEDIVIKWDEDEILSNLICYQKTVDRLYKELNDEMQFIFDLRWMDINNPSWPEIAERLEIHKATIYRKREIILRRYDELSGKL